MGVAISSHAQQADTGTKMIHLGENTKSTIISKGISAMKGVNAYRGLVRVGKKARNISECDSLLIGNTCKAHTYPYHEIKNPSAKIEHEATTSKISDEQLFYLQQRGIDEEDAIAMIVMDFVKRF